VVHAGRRGAIVGDEDIGAAARTGGELNNTFGCIRVHSERCGNVYSTDWYTRERLE
jgi:hypothetical protein